MDRSEAHRKLADRLALYGTCLNAGEKDDIDVELGKANNYAHRLVFGHWRNR